MNALHEQFIVEVRELIHQATDDLLAVERESASTERIDRIFRAFHTLKGSAGVVDLRAMTVTFHAAEDLLAAIRDGKLDVTSAMIDEALACLDQASRWIDAFEIHETLPLQAGEDAQAMARRLRDLTGGIEAEQSYGGGTETGRDHALPDWVSGLIHAEQSNISRHLQEHPGTLIAICYEPRSSCFFDGDDPLALMRRMPDLLAVHIEAREPWPALDELDPYSCNLRLLAISAGSHVELSSIFHLVPDQVRIFTIPTQALTPEPVSRSDDVDTIDLVRAILEEQRRFLAASRHGDDLAGRVGAAARAAANALRHILRADFAKRIETATVTALANADPTCLFPALDESLASLVSDNRSTGGGNAKSMTTSGQAAEHAESVATRWLRVDQNRIDALVNLAGELIVAKNGFAHLARRSENETGGQELALALKREYEALDRLAGEMHGAILQLRMVSVAQVFRSFPRLVRDMSQRLGKKAALVTRGESVEADKTIVDRLFEPLLHLVRNALDHGIESPEQRQDAGKTEEATITLEALRVGDRFVVEVRDDGRGIDPEIVRRKAQERALFTADELAGLPDERVIDLVFSAGFSTAPEVSDISGRGVGMDVVRTTIERSGGRVSLTSSVGSGTTVRLELPTNIAMTRIMVVEAAGQVLGIPMDSVVETVRLTMDRITQIKGNEGFVLRDRIVPICSLAELVNLPKPAIPPSGDRLLVVIESGGKVVAIEVDRIRDQQEVVLKPMQGLLSNARGFAGTTLLGDGKVLLILDIREIVP